MVFSSLIFICRFMPVFFIIYYLCPRRFRNLILFVGSVVFYAWGEPKYTILVLLSILVNYLLARWLSAYEEGGTARFLIFLLSLVYNIGVLLVFKYASFIIENINALTGAAIPDPSLTLPLGISFYTFQIMSYTIDVYKGKCRNETSILRLGTYLVMFPQLIAGPIVIYEKISRDLKHRRISLENVEDGLKTFTLGLGAKVLLANNLGQIWDATAEAGYSNISTGFAWLGITAYSLQLFFDFNGYSLMAIGLGKMLGFDFPENFNYPYTANSATDFWHRWHMTLTGWFREYVYIPLGGNRRGELRTYLNMLVVWLITGLWHGAAWNFVLWGLYYFVILSIERLFLKDILDRSAIFSRIYTLVLVMCGWVLFAAGNLSEAMVYLSRMFTPNGGTEFLEYLFNFKLPLLGGVVFSTPLLAFWYRKHKRNVLSILFLVVVFWGSLVVLTDEVYNPFLYFRF